MSFYTSIYEVYKIFFPGISLSHIPSLSDKYALAELASECFESRFSRLNRYSYVLARWAGRFDGLVDLELADERPGIIKYFVRQSITYDEHVHSFCFAFVRWFQYHPERFHCGTEGVVPEVWCPIYPFRKSWPVFICPHSTFISKVCCRL